VNNIYNAWLKALDAQTSRPITARPSGRTGFAAIARRLSV